MKYLKSYVIFLEDVTNFNEPENLKLAKTNLKSEQDEITEFNSKLKPGLNSIFAKFKDPSVRNKEIDKLLGTENVNKWANEWRMILNDEVDLERMENSILSDVTDINADKSLLDATANTPENKNLKDRLNNQITERNMKKSKTVANITKLNTDITKRQTDFNKRMKDCIQDSKNDINNLSKNQK